MSLGNITPDPAPDKTVKPYKLYSEELDEIFTKFNARNNLVILDEAKYTEEQILKKLENSEKLAKREILSKVKAAVLEARESELKEAIANCEFNSHAFCRENRERLAELEQSRGAEGKITAKLIATCSYCGQEFSSHQEIQEHLEVCAAAPKKSEGDSL